MPRPKTLFAAPGHKLPPLLLLTFALLAFALLALPARGEGMPVAGATTADAAIHGVLNDFHQAAADADQARYLGHFTKDGVFMGTDDWERWPLPAFEGYVAERFAGGTGWTYVPEDRHIMYAPGGATAWFDEVMVSERWGRFRGTGVLLKDTRGWKIAHYSLTALVPNERFAEVAETSKAVFDQRALKAASEKAAAQ